jgi:drug/metabolite transporter (DMT)-like permease
VTSGVLWSLVAALGFGFTQTLNRKSNLLAGPYRTAFGLLVAVELVLVMRTLTTGDWRLLSDAPLAALSFFALSGVVHYVAGWTLLALSQQQIGVARTGAVVASSPLVATVFAALFLGEPFTLVTIIGVVLTVIGVALVAISRSPEAGRSRWTVPWFGLAVATCWGVSPTFIRFGLEGLDAPVLGLTVGLAVALVAQGLLLTVMRGWNRGPWDRKAVFWMALGGVTGAIAISAQWVSFGLTTIAIAFSVQQLSIILVVALAPLMFDAAFERINVLLIAGIVAMLAGSATVVFA